MVFGRRYRATEKIGSGGMADVYKAVDEVLGRTVAVKVMHARYAAEPTFAARFRQEAQAAANLQSPYIVNMYDWGQDGDTYYMVMEYVRGTDLKSLIAQKGALPSRNVAEIGSQVCAALSVAHGYDVIHRDIKPHNIMITPDGSVKVMDFGIARAGNTTMTQTGSVLGTAHYVSPEQAQGKPLTAASDLYSLGVVLYEAGTGRLPFDAETPVAVALKQVSEMPRRPREINPNIDPGLEAVIMTAMSKQPAGRYETAEQMRRDLQRVAAGHQVAPPANPHPADSYNGGKTAVMPKSAPRPANNRGPKGPGPKPKPKPKRLVWPWVLVAALLIAGGLGVAWSMGLLGPQGSAIPDVVGMQLDAAESTLTQAGFVSEAEEVFDGTVTAGVVIEQSPGGGTTAEPDTLVKLTVSKGPKMAEVPEIVGLAEEEARQAIVDAGLKADPLPDDYSTKYSTGTVFKQDPKAGSEVPEGSSVQFVVSRGKRLATVPDVEGDTSTTAKRVIEDAGLKYSISMAFSEEVAKGVVISQNPGPSLQVVEGSTITLVVSKGSEMIDIPDVIGAPQTEAIATLESAGFDVKVNFEPHAENGLVLDQAPKPPTKARPGSTVTLVVDGVAP